MSLHQVTLNIAHDTYSQMQNIVQALDTKHAVSQSKHLGEVLTQMTCEVLDQAFGRLIHEQLAVNPNDRNANESKKVLDQIHEQLHKYMPWSVSFFSNDRLKPMVNYLFEQLNFHHLEKIHLNYKITPQLAKQVQDNFDRLLNGEEQAIKSVLSDLVEVVDVGVTALIREPKNMLKFNFVVDKTLNGVINMVTNIGYKRIEKMGQGLSLPAAQQYATHFNTFVQHLPH